MGSVELFWLCLEQGLELREGEIYITTKVHAIFGTRLGYVWDSSQADGLFLEN